MIPQQNALALLLLLCESSLSFVGALERGGEALSPELALQATQILIWCSVTLGHETTQAHTLLFSR